jgi:PKD repeat protein
MKYYMRKEILAIVGVQLAVLLLGWGHLSAQCEKVGWVSSITPGCGAQIIDLDNGLSFHAVSGMEGLLGGQIISFKTAPAPMPQGCPPSNGLTVSLVCVSDTLPCAAHFGYFADPDDALRFNFVANIYDPSTQICQWTFGDGSVATGNKVSHGFPQQGEYAVCLTVSDAFGCSSEYCETIQIDAQSSNWCGYDIKVTAIGTQLNGKVFSTDPQSLNALQSVVWYSSKSSNLIAQTPDFTAPLPGFGTYLVCAQYHVSNPDDQYTCAATKCQELTVAEPACINPVMADATALCPGQSSLYAPVCGCNGITYGNECEAINAGIATWWAGDCAAQGGTCHAQMEVKIIEGSLDNGYTAQFIHNSVGDFNFAQLDFGDGSDMVAPSSDTILHQYPAGGIYRTNLTVWQTGGCISSAVQLLVTDALNMTISSLPEATDYVRPGDANRDGKANVYDLLNLGVGHYTAGSPRPEASTDWTLQFAPNWAESVANQVNYKHLDCDGNGAVNEYDADVIGQHYTAIDTAGAAQLPNTPQVRIEFSQDTIVVNTNNPTPVEITGTVVLGSPTQPALGIYGLAFGMEYPDYVVQSPESDYKSDFFGSPNHMLWLAKDIHSKFQLDMGMTRKNGQQASGYGAIAEVTFKTDYIIIIDITSRSSNNIMPFAVPIKGIKAIDKRGNIKYISSPTILDTVWMKLIGTTGTRDVPNHQMVVSPNPSSDFVTLFFGDLPVTRIELVNVLGQVVTQVTHGGESYAKLSVNNFPDGMYTLRIHSEKGLVQKQIMVSR